MFYAIKIDFGPVSMRLTHSIGFLFSYSFDPFEIKDNPSQPMQKERVSVCKLNGRVCLPISGGEII